MTAGKYEEKNKQEIARTISSRVRRDTAYVLDVEGLKDRFNVENPHALITVNEPINSTSFIVDMGWLLIIESGTGWRRYRTAVYRRGYSIYVGLEHARYIVRVQNNKRLKKENTPLNMDKMKRW